MAKARKLKQANDSGLNFEGQLWAAAVKLRGYVGASEGLAWVNLAMRVQVQVSVLTIDTEQSRC